MSNNKKYYWLKLMKDFFQQKEIKKLRKIAGGDTYVLIYLKLMLLSINNNSTIYFEKLDDSFEEQLALEIDEEQTNISVVISFCIANNMIIVNNDEYLIVAAQNLTGSETASAERKRNQRERESQKLLNCDIVTPASQTVTQSKSIELEKELDCSSQNIQTTTTISQDFIDAFEKKNFANASITDQYEKFSLYNKNNTSKMTQLNWKRWLDNHKVTSKVETEKREYSWNFKKLQYGSDAIIDWYFTNKQQQLPTFLDFDFEKFKELGISCVRLVHPSHEKHVTIYYKLNGDGEQLLKSLGSKDED